MSVPGTKNKTKTKTNKNKTKTKNQRTEADEEARKGAAGLSMATGGVAGDRDGNGAACVVHFYYDVVCPYAYLASRRIEALVARCGGGDNGRRVALRWRPVLLGGLYELGRAPQGKGGSATDAMPACKRLLAAQDLRRAAARRGAPLAFPPCHPARSLAAMRLLCATPDARRDFRRTEHTSHFFSDRNAPRCTAITARILISCCWVCSAIPP